MLNNIPIELKIEASKKEIIKSINQICQKYNISYYLLSIIISEIYTETEMNKKKELKVLYKRVKEQQEKAQKEQESDKNGEQNNPKKNTV